MDRIRFKGRDTVLLTHNGTEFNIPVERIGSKLMIAYGCIYYSKEGIKTRCPDFEQEEIANLLLSVKGGVFVLPPNLTQNQRQTAN